MNDMTNDEAMRLTRQANDEGLAHAMDRLRGDCEQGQAVAWIKPDWSDPKNFDGKSPVTTYPQLGWTPLYIHPQPVAGDAVRALPGKWRETVTYGDHSPEAMAVMRCAAELAAALSTQPAPSEQVAASVAVPDWQPIETAPRDGTEILAWDGEDRIVTHWCKFRDGFGDPYEGWIHPNIGELGPSLAMPTHWQTLAAAPVAPERGVRP